VNVEISQFQNFGPI